MNPIAAIRELMESYVEGVRVSKLGPNYDLDRQKTQLDMENARARNARDTLEGQREGEAHTSRMETARRAAEVAGLERSTAIAEATKHGHAGDLTGVADHASEVNLTKAGQETAESNARIASAQALEAERKRKPPMEALRMQLIRAQIAASQSRDANSRVKNNLEVQRLQAQLAGTYDPDSKVNPRTPKAGGTIPWSTAIKLATEYTGNDDETSDEVVEEAQRIREMATPKAPVSGPTVEAPAVAPSQAPPPAPAPASGKQYKIGGAWKTWDLLTPSERATIEKLGVK